MTGERICVLYADRPAGRDGIRDYSDALVIALNDLGGGVEAHLVLYGGGHPWRAAAQGASAVMLQYNPFSYGRWGFAPALVADLRRLGDPALSVMVHEPYVPITDWRSALMGGWQRVQLRCLLAGADVVAVSTEGFRRYLPLRHRAAATHLPVGSPLPDARERRAEFRARAGARADRPVVAVYGSAHPSRPLGHVVAAIDSLARAVSPPVILNLGADAPELPGLADGVDVVRPGPLRADELAAWLAAADLALLPFVDGASTRRTTVAAALQQEVCVVSTSGALTDPELRRASSPVLTPVGDIGAFAQMATRLAVDRQLRTEHAASGRRLYDERYAWPVIAQRLMDTLRGAREP